MSNEATKRRKLIIWLVIVTILMGLVVWAFYDGLTVRHYDYQSDKLSEGQSVRIVVVADLHSVLYGQGQRGLIERIVDAQPDIIALPGDIIDDDRAIEENAHLFFEGIQGIAPAYYVSGNHEFWSGEIDRLKDIVRSYGVTVLENERRTIAVNGVQLCISGVDDPEVMEYTDDPGILALDDADDLLGRFINLDDTSVNILLAHRPERFEAYQNYDFDLVLSGHAHGGQVRIPLILNGVFAPEQGYFPEYAGGEYFKNGATMIVSRGLGFDSRVPRIFNPPEVVVVDILPAR